MCARVAQQYSRTHIVEYKIYQYKEERDVLRGRDEEIRRM